MLAVIYGYSLGLLTAALLFVTAIIVARLMRRWLGVITPKFRSIWFLIGTMCLFIAGLVRVGRAIETLGGESLPERVDQILFWMLSCLGFAVLLTDWVWVFETLRGESPETHMGKHQRPPNTDVGPSVGRPAMKPWLKGFGQKLSRKYRSIKFGRDKRAGQIGCAQRVSPAGEGGVALCAFERLSREAQ